MSRVTTQINSDTTRTHWARSPTKQLRNGSREHTAIPHLPELHSALRSSYQSPHSVPFCEYGRFPCPDSWTVDISARRPRVIRSTGSLRHHAQVPIWRHKSSLAFPTRVHFQSGVLVAAIRQDPWRQAAGLLDRTRCAPAAGPALAARPSLCISADNRSGPGAPDRADPS